MSDIEQLQREIKEWEQSQLTRDGKYLSIGLGKKSDAAMKRFGFPYGVGDAVPVADRYSAMIKWRRAFRAFVAWQRGDARG